MERSQTPHGSTLENSPQQPTHGPKGPEKIANRDKPQSQVETSQE